MTGGGGKGPGGVCPGCGGRHAAPATTVAIGPDALDRLARFLDDRAWRRLLLVSDPNTDEVLADRVARSLAGGGRAVERCRFPERHGLVADRPAVDRVRAALSSVRPDGTVVVGSGTLNDITRYATWLEEADYVSVPTAASMDGYASTVAAMQFEGVKVSFPAHGPAGIFADAATLAAAPREMTSWGLGDLLGKATAGFDWLLGAAVTGEPYCPEVAQRVQRPLQLCLDRPEALLAGRVEEVTALAEGLVESGVAMGMFGNSRPASGAEHHFSHFWDLLAYRQLRPHGPHGLQVAYATGAVMQLQRHALETLDQALTSPPGQEAAGESEWFGERAASAELAEVRDDKRAAWAAYGPSWPPAGPRLATARAALEQAVADFPRVTAALDLAGVPRSAGFLDVDGPALRATVRFANRLRSRFTALDLLESQGRLAGLADELLAAWS